MKTLLKIPRCYDSHLHLLGTGIFLEGLSLFNLQSLSDLENIQIQDSYFKGSWLVGFGWDHMKWPGQKWPTAADLDVYFPDIPVAFSRADGHTLWLNSLALKKLGYFQKTESEKAIPRGGIIFRDGEGYPTGIFQEHAKLEVDFFIPDYSRDQKIQFIQSALRHLRLQGFTHLRDMTGNQEQWDILWDLDELKKLNQYIEQNFVCENRADFPRALGELERAASMVRKKLNGHLRAVGIKLFFDGSLGSEGAYLSQNYRFSHQKGILLWEEKDLIHVIAETWKKGFQIAIHTIGDEAAHRAALAALQVQTELGVRGHLSMEHAQILRAETIEILKKLNAASEDSSTYQGSVTCHMQPCHYLNDRRWLKEKLGDLYSRSFPWRELVLHQIPIQFGSDSPIEPADVFRNQEALRLSASEGIPPLIGEWHHFHSHPDPNWGAHCVSVFSEGTFIESSEL